MCRFSAPIEKVTWHRFIAHVFQTGITISFITNDTRGATIQLCLLVAKGTNTHSSGYGFPWSLRTALSHCANRPSSSLAVLGGAVDVRYRPVAPAALTANGSDADDDALGWTYPLPNSTREAIPPFPGRESRRSKSRAARRRKGQSRAAGR